MKSLCLVLCAFFSLLLQAGSALSTCEQKVLEEVERCGLHIGYDAIRGEFVSVQHALYDCKDSVGQSWQLIRDRAFDEALSKAQLEIAQGMRSAVNGSNSVRLRQSGKASLKVVESTFMTESNDMLLGFEIIAVHEVIHAGQYGMAMAVVWGEDREMATARSFSGDSLAADDWEDQLRSRVLSFGAGVPRLNSFTDSSGFVHCYAASVSDVSRIPVSLQSIRIGEGKAKTQRRLQLWRDGRGRICSHMNLSLESRKGESTRLRREHCKKLDSSVRGVMPQYVCIFDGDVCDSLSGRMLHVQVYALDPGGAISVTSGKKHKRQAESFAGKPVKVFNYATGKYEEVNK